MGQKPKPISPGIQMAGSQRGDLDQYFDYFFGSHRPAMMPAGEGWHPAADVYETETNIIIVVDIAGISVNDVNLVLKKENLILQGTRYEKANDQTRHYHKMEVAYGPFERVFRLPSPVKSDSIQAEYKDGLMVIKMDKKQAPQAGRRDIKIR